MHLYEVIRPPLITEKNSTLQSRKIRVPGGRRGEQEQVKRLSRLPLR